MFLIVAADNQCMVFMVHAALQVMLRTGRVCELDSGIPGARVINHDALQFSVQRVSVHSAPDKTRTSW